MRIDPQLLSMVQTIAHTQARLYYKPEELHPQLIVTRSVFLLIHAIVAVQLTRTGLSAAELEECGWVPGVIVQEMERVGWDLTGLAPQYERALRWWPTEV